MTDTDSLLDRIAHGMTDQDDAEAVRSIIEERDRAAGKQRHVHERHVHKAGPLGDIDTCRRCGRDLRDEIHVRY